VAYSLPTLASSAASSVSDSADSAPPSSTASAAVADPSHLLEMTSCPRCEARVFRAFEPHHGDYEIKCEMGHLLGFLDCEDRFTPAGHTPAERAALYGQTSPRGAGRSACSENLEERVTETGRERTRVGSRV
jgi:hypothetical protein